MCNRPMAAIGLTSYRYPSPYGWIMIGARDDDDALREANRSLSSGRADGAKLERWSDGGYVPVTVYRDIDLRALGYDPIAGFWQFRDPGTAFRQPSVMAGDAVVFQIGRDIWGVYDRTQVTA